jgi:hypothetical protein
MSIYKKLLEVKAEIGKVTKNANNPHFKNTYADINALLEAVEPILHKHELLLLQPIIDGSVVTQIMSMDKSEVVISELKLPEIIDPQKIGSAITYYRRYTLQSLLGLQAEDDDANLVSAKAPQTKPLPALTSTAAQEHANKKTTLDALKKLFVVTKEQEDKYLNLIK